MKNDNQFYARLGSMDKYRLYNIENEKITLQKEITLSEKEEPYFLADGGVAIFTEKNQTKTVKVNGENWKNKINKHL
jgi:hypothetical protein